MKRGERSLEELKMASDFLCYEIWMFRLISKTLLIRIAEKSPLKNALLETFVIHLRNLIDFFYLENPYKDDIVFDDFFQDDIERKPKLEKSQILEIARQRAHKEVAHLTYLRKIDTKEKEWDINVISEEMDKLIDLFEQNVNPDFLGPRWKQLL